MPRKATAKPHKRPAAKAPKQAPRPAAKPQRRPLGKTPAKAPKAAPKARAKATATPAHDPLDSTPTPRNKALLPVDPLDVTPTPPIPGAYIGVYKNTQRRACLAYKRDDYHVWTVMFDEDGGQRVLVKWGADDFDANMRRLRYPHQYGPYYPVPRAIAAYFQPGAVYTDSAYRVLSKLARGIDPDEEDTIDDILDMTPSAVPRARPLRTRTPAAKLDRKAKRHAKLAAMNPAELRAWRDKRNARRKLRRANAKKGKAK